MNSLHRLHPLRTQASLTNPLWLNYCMCILKRDYIKVQSDLEFQLLLMQREPGQKEKRGGKPSSSAKSWIVIRKSTVKISA